MAGEPGCCTALSKSVQVLPQEVGHERFQTRGSNSEASPSLERSSCNARCHRHLYTWVACMSVSGQQDSVGHDFGGTLTSRVFAEVKRDKCQPGMRPEESRGGCGCGTIVDPKETVGCGMMLMS